MADQSGKQGSPSLKEQFWDPVAGFGVTFRTMFRKVVTEQYPKEKFPTAPRFHGRGMRIGEDATQLDPRWSVVESIPGGWVEPPPDAWDAGDDVGL